MKSFDELFSEFFNQKPKPLSKDVTSIINDLINNINNNMTQQKPTSDSVKDKVKNIIDTILNPTNSIDDAINSGDENIIAKKLGVDMSNPDSVEEVIENGLKFTKMIWNTPQGKLVKVVVTDVIDGEEKLKKPKSLEEQLQDAIDVEDYELAAKLRDSIRLEKKVD